MTNLQSRTARPVPVCPRDRLGVGAGRNGRGANPLRQEDATQVAHWLLTWLKVGLQGNSGMGPWHECKMSWSCWHVPSLAEVNDVVCSQALELGACSCRDAHSMPSRVHRTLARGCIFEAFDNTGFSHLWGKISWG